MKNINENVELILSPIILNNISNVNLITNMKLPLLFINMMNNTVNLMVDYINYQFKAIINQNNFNTENILVRVEIIDINIFTKFIFGNYYSNNVKIILKNTIDNKGEMLVSHLNIEGKDMLVLDCLIIKDSKFNSQFVSNIIKKDNNIVLESDSRFTISKTYFNYIKDKKGLFAISKFKNILLLLTNFKNKKNYVLKIIKKYFNVDSDTFSDTFYTINPTINKIFLSNISNKIKINNNNQQLYNIERDDFYKEIRNKNKFFIKFYYNRYLGLFTDIFKISNTKYIFYDNKLIIRSYISKYEDNTFIEYLLTES